MGFKKFDLLPEELLARIFVPLPPDNAGRIPRWSASWTGASPQRQRPPPPGRSGRRKPGPLPPDNAGSAYYKYTRRNAMDLALMGVSAYVEVREGVEQVLS